MFRKTLFGPKKYPLVLMLEPLHACNLRCSGCGRIREYADTLHQRMTLDDCLSSAKECGAPIVSICGGEPLLYNDIVPLVDELLKQGRLIYLCTNGLLLEEKIGAFVELAKKNRYVKSRFYWNVHLDGLAKTHDAIVERPGTFDQALRGIQAAKQHGFYLYTNTTLYRNCDIDELHQFCETMRQNRVDGLMIAPGFGYESVGNESFFLTRQETNDLFREIRKRFTKFRLTATPFYLDFLCGDIALRCAAWANPTRNVRGWRGPCYLLPDQHFTTFQELLDKTNWDALGFGNDVRCADCLMHCGYEPAAVLFRNNIFDLLRIGYWQLG